MNLDFENGVPFIEAILYSAARKVELPSVYYGSLIGIQRAQAFSIAGLSSMSQIQYVLDLLSVATANGSTFAEFQKDVESGKLDVTLPRYRLDNIFRTNIMSGYNRGRYQQQTDTKADLPYWMYDAVNDSRVRPAHHAMDGTILPADDPWWDTHYPPNGYRCRCIVISLTEKQAVRRGGVTPYPNADESKPDDGWDYCVGKDYTGSVKKAVSSTADNLKILTPKNGKDIDKAVADIQHGANAVNRPPEDILKELDRLKEDK